MESTEVFAGGTAAAIIAHALSILRDRGWITSINQHRAAAFVLSLMTSLGMQFKFDAATGEWALSGTLMGLLVGLWHTAIQYGFVDAFYKQWARITLTKVFEQGGGNR